MNKTEIEWALNPDGSPGYTWNPITGCLNHDNGMCKGGGFPCYAYKLANTRLGGVYLSNPNVAPLYPSAGAVDIDVRHMRAFYPRLWPDRIDKARLELANAKPRGIFICDMSDLFGLGVPENWTSDILDVITEFSEHRFYLLTKQPQNLIKFSPFPDNAWVGVTATNWMAFSNALGHLATIDAKVKYLSIEPLLEKITLDMLQEMLLPRVINWLIIGAQTKPYKPPKLEWVKAIVDAADKAGIPVFLKNNLEPIIGDPRDNWQLFDHFEPMAPVLRQEMPEVE